MAEPFFIEVVVLDFKPDATVEDATSAPGKTWEECVTILKNYLVKDHRFFFGRQIEDQSGGYLVSSK